MVEVDRERGRIGLRLADDPEIAGKSVEELAARRQPRGGPNGGGDRGDRRRGDRAAATGATATATAARAARRPRPRRTGRARTATASSPLSG